VSLDRVLTYVKVATKFAIRHARRQQRQKLALAFGYADLAPRPLQRCIDLGALGPLGQNDSIALRGSSDAVNDLLPWRSLGDKSLSTGAHGLTHRQRPIGKAEHHDRSITGVGAKRAHSFVEGFGFSVRVEQRDIDPSPRSLPNIEFHDLDLGLTGLEQGTEALKNDHIVIDERDPYRFGHDFILRVSDITSKSPDRVIDREAPFRQAVAAVARRPIQILGSRKFRWAMPASKENGNTGRHVFVEDPLESWLPGPVTWAPGSFLRSSAREE
jgi:hypothetical protein